MIEWLAPDAVSRELRVTPRTVYEWLYTGAMKASKIGGIWRIHREDLKSFLGRTRAQEETQLREDIERWQGEGGS